MNTFWWYVIGCAGSFFASFVWGYFLGWRFALRLLKKAENLSYSFEPVTCTECKNTWINPVPYIRWEPLECPKCREMTGRSAWRK